MGQPLGDVQALRAQAAAADSEAALELTSRAVEEAAAARGRRLLLLIDNLDEILDQVGTGDEMATRRLRSLLQHSPRYMLVGSTTAIFDELVNYQRPLYQFFAPIYLRPLDDQDVQQLLRRRAEVDANQLFLSPSRELRQKVRVITTLTGGNPRLVVALYDV